MVNKHMKRCSTSLAIREIKPQNDSIVTPAQMAMIKIIEGNTSVIKKVEKLESSYIEGWECKVVRVLQKTVWQFLKMIELPYDPAIPFLGIDPREIKKTFST